MQCSLPDPDTRCFNVVPKHIVSTSGLVVRARCSKHLVSGIWETTLHPIYTKNHTKDSGYATIYIHIYNFKVTGKYNTYNSALKDGGSDTWPPRRTPSPAKGWLCPMHMIPSFPFGQCVGFLALPMFPMANAQDS